MNPETLNNILQDPEVKAALQSKYWTPREAEVILEALCRSGLEPRRFAEQAGISYRRLRERLQRRKPAQPAATAQKSPCLERVEAGPAACVPGPFVPLQLTPTAIEAAPQKARPAGLKIRFYRPTPQTEEQLVLELEVPLW